MECGHAWRRQRKRSQLVWRGAESRVAVRPFRMSLRGAARSDAGVVRASHATNLAKMKSKARANANSVRVRMIVGALALR